MIIEASETNQLPSWSVKLMLERDSWLVEVAGPSAAAGNNTVKVNFHHQTKILNHLNFPQIFKKILKPSTVHSHCVPGPWGGSLDMYDYVLCRSFPLLPVHPHFTSSNPMPHPINPPPCPTPSHSTSSCQAPPYHPTRPYPTLSR